MKRNRHPLRALLLPLLLLLSPGWNIAARADQTVYLTVSVTDEQGNVVSGARVNVYQEEAKRSHYFDIPTPPDYQEDTNAQGLARLQIKVATGQGLDITVEVSREGMKAESHNISLGKNFPTRLPLEKFTLKKRSEALAGPIINVIIEVRDMEGNPVDGAQVLIRDTSLGLVTGRFNGVTGADGKTTIPVFYGSPDKQNTLPAEASKSGYKTARIGVPLTQKQVGKTIAGGTIKLQREVTNGTKVTVTARDKNDHHGIGEASVVLDGPGYYSDSTNGSGEVAFYVAETGTFNVRISQDTYRRFSAELTVLKEEKDKGKAVTYELEPKANKDEGRDIIDVTVLKKDPTDEKSKPAPLAGAYLKAGTTGATTDSNGKATLQGAFEEQQQVSVEASGYKSQSKTVHVAKALHYSAGKGDTTFTLDPELSENSPIRIIVEVQDMAGAKIDHANVEFYSASGLMLRGIGTKEDGYADFRSSDRPDVPIAELRKGISVNVKKAPQYKEVLNRSVPSNLLKPSLEAGTFLVQLDRDWSELEKALGDLEARGAALKNEATAAMTQAKSVDAIVAKFPAAKGRVESILADLRKAQQVFDPKVVEKRCQEATKLVEEIKGAQSEAEKKEESLKKKLDEAIGLAAHCKSKADGDVIKTKHRDAIRDAGEIGVLGKKAAEANGKLARMAETMKSGGNLETQLQQALEKIEGELSSAKKDSSGARSQFVDAFATSRTIPGRRAGLLDELNKLKAKFEVQKNDALLPPELKTRITNLEQLIASIPTPTPPELSRLDEVMTPVLAQLEQSTTEARGIVSSFSRAICNVQSMDEAVQEINSRVTGVTIELAAAADLPSKADACIAAASQTPSPAADEITVPDVSGYTDPAAMKAAAAPNMVGVIIATKATPSPGSTKLFAYQDPPANSKAKRGSPLKIYIYQSLAAVATPSPIPTPSDEVTVPDVSTAGNDPKAMKAAAGPDMVGVIVATKASPSPGATKLFASQDPPANSKAKRGSTLKIFIFQSLAEASATPSPSASSSPTPFASPTSSPSPTLSGAMPDLTGLTLEQAVARLPSNMRIGGDEAGDKPPRPELAMTIFAQTPAPGARFDPRKPPVVRVKRYGSAKSTVGTGPERFDGTYVGSYSGSDHGTVRFTVSGGAIAITSPGRGTGQISASGSASISGSGADGNSSYTFSGIFSLGADGRAGASGRWSGEQQGFKGTGTWSAARR